MALFEMKIKKNLFKVVDLFFNYFHKGPRDAILKISIECNRVKFSFHLFKAYTF